VIGGSLRLWASETGPTRVRRGAASTADRHGGRPDGASREKSQRPNGRYPRNGHLARTSRSARRSPLGLAPAAGRAAGCDPRSVVPTEVPKPATAWGLWECFSLYGPALRPTRGAIGDLGRPADLRSGNATAQGSSVFQPAGTPSRPTLGVPASAYSHPAGAFANSAHSAGWATPMRNRRGRRRCALQVDALRPAPPRDGLIDYRPPGLASKRGGVAGWLGPIGRRGFDLERRTRPDRLRDVLARWGEQYGPNWADLPRPSPPADPARRGARPIRREGRVLGGGAVGSWTRKTQMPATQAATEAGGLRSGRARTWRSGSIRAGPDGLAGLQGRARPPEWHAWAPPDRVQPASGRIWGAGRPGVRTTLSRDRLGREYRDIRGPAP